MYPRLALNFSCRWGWPWTSDCRASWVLGLQRCITSPVLCGDQDWTRAVCPLQLTPSLAPSLLFWDRLPVLLRLALNSRVFLPQLRRHAIMPCFLCFVCISFSFYFLGEITVSQPDLRLPGSQEHNTKTAFNTSKHISCLVKWALIWIMWSLTCLCWFSLVNVVIVNINKPFNYQ